MPDEHIEGFLKAEAEAANLAGTLRKLKDEIGSYRDAREALNKSSEAITKCTAKLGTIAEEIGQVAKVLREIGTPAIVGAIDNLKSQLTETSARTERRVNIAMIALGLGLLVVLGAVFLSR